MDIISIENALKNKRLRLYISSHTRAAEDIWILGGYEDLIGADLMVMALNGDKHPSLGKLTAHDKAKYLWLNLRTHKHRAHFMQISSMNPESESGVNAYCNSLEECFTSCFELLKKHYSIDINVK